VFLHTTAVHDEAPSYFYFASVPSGFGSSVYYASGR